MAFKIEGKAKVIACCWNNIKGQIKPESYYSTAKNSCLTTIKNFDQKLRDKKDLIDKLSQLGSLERIPDLFDKKFEQRTIEFFHSAGSDRILGNNTGVGAPVVRYSKIKTTKNLITQEWKRNIVR